MKYRKKPVELSDRAKLVYCSTHFDRRLTRAGRGGRNLPVLVRYLL